jgi:hypothetical protein
MPADDPQSLTYAIERLIERVDALTVAVREASATVESAVKQMPQRTMSAMGVRTEE